jgi:tetratricopeptide (TPR) repeat protein
MSTNVRRTLLGFLCSLTVLAQVPREPFDIALESYRKAHAEGRFGEAVAHREDARALLNRTPVEAPQFASWLQQVAQLYQGTGMNLQFRTVAQEALARAGKLGDSHPTRIALLNMLADSWQQDGSLLKSVAYIEQAVAAQEAAQAMKAPASAAQASSQWFNARLTVTGCCQNRFGAVPNLVYPYQRLADAYQRLGRPEAVAGVVAKMQTLIKNNASELASFYKWQGQFDQAAAIYRKLAEQASSPQEAADFLRQASDAYAQEQRYDAAAASLQQAVAALESSGDPPARDQTTWMRQYIANLMRQAGQIELADQIDRQLLAERQDYLAHHAELPVVKFPNGKSSLGDEMARAQTAASEGKFDDAFTLGLHAIDAASGAADRDQISWQVASIARAMVQRKQPALAEKLYQRLFGAVQSWSSDTPQPLLNAAHEYPAFLMAQPDRYSEVPAAIERYRDLLISADGADSGLVTQALRLTIDFERFHGSKDKALHAAQDLLALEESLSGRTSEPYLGVIELLAQVYQFNGDAGAALPLQRQAVALADLTSRPNGIQRGQRRINLAFALARQLQFDEAEGLAAEAVAIGQSARPPADFANQLQQIRQMRKAALR